MSNLSNTAATMLTMTSDAEAIEREAWRLFREMTATRGARWVVPEGPFAEAVIGRLREIAAGQTVPPWSDPH